MNIEKSHVREVSVKYIGKKIESPRIGEPEDVAKFMRKVIGENSREKFIALYLDGAHFPIGYDVIGIGQIDRCNVDGAEIYRRALLAGAKALIVSHNHPSGELTPSTADLSITSALKAGCKTIGISLLDHVIFSDREHYSMQVAGQV